MTGATAAVRPKSISAPPTHTPVSPMQRRSSIRIAVGMICVAIVLFLMLATSDAAPQKYKYKQKYGATPPATYKSKPKQSYGTPPAATYKSKPKQNHGYPQSTGSSKPTTIYHEKPSLLRRYPAAPGAAAGGQNNAHHTYMEDDDDDSASCPANPTCEPRRQHYRSEDGSCNNLDNPTWGQSGLPYIRVLERQHSLVDCGRASHLPNPRLVSGTLIRRGEEDYSEQASIMVMIYGQVIDHDMMKTPENVAVGDCCKIENRMAPSCCPIIAPPSDHFYGKEGRSTCIEFLRSVRVKGIDCGAGSDVQNENTPFIDASFLYGSDQHQADVVRAFEGGALRSLLDVRHRMFPPTPRNISDLKTVPVSGCCDMGDRRGDAHSGFLLIHIALLRLHNSVAERLSEMHPGWSDNWLFQETKKIVVAIHQHITYTEWLDRLLGTPNHVHVHAYQDGYEDVYDPEVDPTISMVFSTASYRLHTLIPGYYSLRDANYKETNRMQLRDNFRNPKALSESNNFDDLIRGLATQPIHDFDNVFTTEMTEWLFPKNDTNNPNVRSGIDIVAANVQRGRDHQLPTYPSYRAFCGYKKPETWTDMTDLISPDHVHRLFHIYASPADVDLYIGQVMERPVPGSLLGPTSHCIVRDQFERIKSGDRFFYTNSHVFSHSQVSAIKRMTLSRLLCDYADDPSEMKLPRDMFRVVTDNKGDNPLLSCRDTVNIPALDLEAWR